MNNSNIVKKRATFTQRFNELKQGINSKHRKSVTLDDIRIGTKDKISIQSLSKYKNGTANPSLEYAALLANYFGVTLDYLAGNAYCPRKDLEDIHEEYGLTPVTLHILKMLKIKKNDNLDLIINALEILIKHVGKKYGDALTTIAKYLHYTNDSKLYLINDTILDDFEDSLATTDSIEDIKKAYDKLVYDIDANMPPLLNDISKGTIYLQDIQNKLSTLKVGLNDSKEYEEEIIPVDWTNYTLIGKFEEKESNE